MSRTIIELRDLDLARDVLRLHVARADRHVQPYGYCKDERGRCRVDDRELIAHWALIQVEPSCRREWDRYADFQDSWLARVRASPELLSSRMHCAILALTQRAVFDACVAEVTRSERKWALDVVAACEHAVAPAVSRAPRIREFRHRMSMLHVGAIRAEKIMRLFKAGQPICATRYIADPSDIERTGLYMAGLEDRLGATLILELNTSAGTTNREASPEGDERLEKSEPLPTPAPYRLH